MNKAALQRWTPVLAILAISAFYFGGILNVPFHPDESTQIFMSSDLEALLTKPQDLFWHPNQEQDSRQRYRELDAPLTRYLIGVGRLATGLNAVPVDWDWSLSWQANQQNGALPDGTLLLAARLAVAALFPFSLFLIFQTAESIGGRFCAWIALVLLASNALILLHTRRAMAESALVFGVAFTLWGLVRLVRAPWLLAVPIALAFNAKQSTAVLMAAGLLAVLWPPAAFSASMSSRLRQAAAFFGIFAAITLLLNPFLWSNPMAAGAAAWNARQDLLHRQVEMMAALQSGLAPPTVSERPLTLAAQLFLAPPAIAEVGNYLPETQSAAVQYFSNPLHTLLRGQVGGGIMLFLTLAGFTLAIFHVLRQPPQNKRPLALLCSASLAQFLALCWIPLAFQRYTIPLAPFVALWAAYGVHQLRLFIRIKKFSPLKHGEK